MKGMPQATGDSSQDSQEPAAEGSPAGGVDARPKETEKEPVTKVALGAGKERLKAGASRLAEGRGEVGKLDVAQQGGQIRGCWFLGCRGRGVGRNGAAGWVLSQVSPAVTKRAGILC